MTSLTNWYSQGYWVFIGYSSLLPIAVIKHSDQLHLGKEWVYLAQTSRSQSMVEGHQDRTWTQTRQEYRL